MKKKMILQEVVMTQGLDLEVKKGQKQNQKLAGLFVWNWGTKRKKTIGSQVWLWLHPLKIL